MSARVEGFVSREDEFHFGANLDGEPFCSSKSDCSRRGAYKGESIQPLQPCALLCMAEPPATLPILRSQVVDIIDQHSAALLFL